MNKEKTVFIFKILSAVLFIAAMVYFMLYSVLVFPQKAMDSVNNEAEGLAEAFAVAFGTSIGIVVVCVILSIIAFFGVLCGICLLVFSSITYKKAKKGNGLGKSRTVFLVIGAAMQLIFLIFTLCLMKDMFLLFIPTVILQIMGAALFVWGSVLEYKKTKPTED